MMTPIAAFGYLLIGWLIGVFCGIFMIVWFKIAIPAALAEWQNYKKAKESRKGVNKALANLNAITDKVRKGAA